MLVSWTVLLASAIHIITGIMILLYPIVATLPFIARLTIWFYDYRIVGIVFILTGMLAVSALIVNGKRPWQSVLMLVVQQCMLLLSSLSAVFMIFGDGLYFAKLSAKIVILADQLPIMLLAVFHTFAVWNMYDANQFFVELFSRLNCRRFVWWPWCYLKSIWTKISLHLPLLWS